MDLQHAIQLSFDPTKRALRIKTSGLTDIPSSPNLDAAQSVDRLYDGANHAIRGEEVTPLGPTNGTHLDWEQVIQRVLQDSDGKLAYVIVPP